MDFGTLGKKAVSCFKHCLIGHTSRSMLDNGADNDLKCCGLAQKVSEKNFRMLLRNRICVIFLKTVAVFFFLPHLKSLPEAKVKSFGLIPLAKEISKQPSIDSVMWLLVRTLMKNYVG